MYGNGTTGNTYERDGYTSTFELRDTNSEELTGNFFKVKNGSVSF